MKLVVSPENPCPEGVVTGSIKTPDRATLRFARWDAALQPRGTVCVFTGRSEFIEKYFETVSDLRARGFAVAAMDWRGQGHSSRQLADPRKGHLEAFSEFETDVETFMQDVVLPNCPPPYHALAHSMGGAAMLRVARSPKRWFDRLVLVAPMIDFPRGRSSWPLRMLMRSLRLAGFGSRYVPGSNVDASRAKGFPGNPLTTDPVRYARNAAIVAEAPSLGIGSPTVAWLDAAFTAMTEFRDIDYPSRIAQPVLLVAPGDDTIVSVVAIAEFAARLPSGSYLVVEGARHELLQEQDGHRAKFWAAFDAFVGGSIADGVRRGWAVELWYCGRKRLGARMWSQVTLPLWVVVLAALLAALAVIDRILVPSVRWALRRRANRAIDELNTRLKLRIQPFKLTKRQVLIDRLAFDPEVLHAADEYARESGVPREVALEKVKRYSSEIVPSFSAYAYFRIGTRIARAVSQMLYRVRIGVRSDEALAAVDPASSVIFVINHRSNMDYVLVTYVAATSSALSYAVGEWAQVWGLRGLIRSMGAYFISRDSREGLYRKVLARYVHMATTAGVTQAIFPEGGLTRDGRLRPPKFGLLSYMVQGFDPLGPRDVVFIPVAVNYDRVLEDRMLTGVASTEPGKKPVFGFNAAEFAGQVFHHIWMAIRGEWYRFGYTCVSFGEPVSLRKYVTEKAIDFRTLAPEPRHAEIEKFGTALMDAVGRVVPVLPVSLVATVMLDAEDRRSLLEIKERVSGLIGELEGQGTYVHIPRADRDYAIAVGLRMLTLRHLVLEVDGSYRANPKELILLRYYANSIAHLFPVIPGREQSERARNP